MATGEEGGRDSEALNPVAALNLTPAPIGAPVRRLQSVDISICT